MARMSREEVEKTIRNARRLNEIVDLRGKDLSEVNLVCLDLRGADLSGANLYMTELRDTNLQNASLNHANLENATLRRANLTGANLNQAKLYGTNLELANLIGAKLNHAYLRNANLGSAKLNNASLLGANLVGADLNFATFDGAIMSKANLMEANAYHAWLHKANLVDANLFGADLKCVDLRESNLFNANLIDSDLRGAKLDGANLDKARFDRAKQGKYYVVGVKDEARNTGPIYVDGVEADIEVIPQKVVKTRQITKTCETCGQPVKTDVWSLHQRSHRKPTPAKSLSPKSRTSVNKESEKEIVVMPNGTKPARPVKQCPVCKSLVREDRLPGHIRKVHPPDKLNKLVNKPDVSQTEAELVNVDNQLEYQEEALYQSNYESQFGDKYVGQQNRDWDGTFGSTPLYDDYGDESDAD